jgi:transcriptional regulator with XRE-family HTH domain
MAADDLSRQLKRRRRQAGLSLSQLARRADTSAATLSRYENGWARFEIYTLRKLATALGCRLAVRLEPQSRPPGKAVRRAEAVRQLKRLFWDHDLRGQDFDEHGQWVLERVLEYGSLPDVRLLMNLMGRERFLEGVRRARFQSVKTEEFWRSMLRKEGIPCTKKRSPAAAWSF